MPQIKTPAPQQHIGEVATAFHERLKTCGSKARLEFLLLLLGGPKDVSTLARISGLDMPTVSRHLSALKGEGLVTFQAVRSRRVHALSGGIRIQERGTMIEMLLSVGNVGAMSLLIPKDFVTRLQSETVSVDNEVALEVTVKELKSRVS